MSDLIDDSDLATPGSVAGFKLLNKFRNKKKSTEIKDDAPKMSTEPLPKVNVDVPEGTKIIEAFTDDVVDTLKDVGFFKKGKKEVAK